MAGGGYIRGGWRGRRENGLTGEWGGGWERGWVWVVGCGWLGSSVDGFGARGRMCESPQTAQEASLSGTLPPP